MHFGVLCIFQNYHDVLVMPKYGSMPQSDAVASMGLFAREVIPKM